MLSNMYIVSVFVCDTVCFICSIWTWKHRRDTIEAQQNCSGAEGRCLSKFNICLTKLVITNTIFSVKKSTLLEENKVQYILMHDHGNNFHNMSLNDW